MDPLVIAAISVAVGAGAALAYQNYSKQKSPGKESPKEENIPDARAREIIVEAKDEAFRIKREAEEEARKIRAESLSVEAKLAAREETMEKRLESVEREQKAFAEKEAELEKTRSELIAKLEKVAGVTREEAKKLILEATETHLKEDISKRIKEAEEQIKKGADEKAKEILIDAMRHGATDYVVEYTTSTIKLQDEDMKGRIIGKEGRNVKAFENASGVDVDLDDPGVIRLSSFDGERREVAKVALERLMVDGRIQPARIEEILDRVRKEFDKLRRDAGEELAREVGVHNLPLEIVDTLGRFKWRFSYGQNLWIHTLEETKIGIAIAREIGADINVVRMGCLFHDIGKVFTPEQEGTHVQVGSDFIRKFKFDPKVVACIEEHHEDKPFSSIESVIVWIADAISGSRPGARHEAVEDYIKRLKDIENIATSFQGVDRSFAISAGREVRVIVFSEQINDADITKMAHDIAEKIEKSVTYPGQVKVVVMRETRAEAVAK
jgi:ribonuclease Y